MLDQDLASARQYLENSLGRLEVYRDRLSANLSRVNSKITDYSKALEILEFETPGDFTDLGEFYLEPLPVPVQQLVPRKPNELIASPFRKGSLSRAILTVMRTACPSVNGQSARISTEELVTSIYLVSVESEEEYRACRATLTVAINRLVQTGKLVRQKNGVFTLGTEIDNQRAVEGVDISANEIKKPKNRSG
jgi:hypothetical protein